MNENRTSRVNHHRDSDEESEIREEEEEMETVPTLNLDTKHG